LQRVSSNGSSNSDLAGTVSNEGIQFPDILSKTLGQGLKLPYSHDDESAPHLKLINSTRAYCDRAWREAKKIAETKEHGLLGFD
jgi:hypothetical protein